MRNEYIIKSYSNRELLKIIESSVGIESKHCHHRNSTILYQLIRIGELWTMLTVNRLNEAQKQEHVWEISWTNITTKPSPIWTTYIILHETTGADVFFSISRQFHWSFNCIERSIETEMVSPKKHSWTEQNHDNRWEINQRQFFGMSKKAAGPTGYGVNQFQILKHGILPIPCSTGADK